MSLTLAFPRVSLRRAAHRYRVRHARLPWRQLEAEAARQGCSAADILYDRAGRGARLALAAAAASVPAEPRVPPMDLGG